MTFKDLFREWLIEQELYGEFVEKRPGEYYSARGVSLYVCENAIILWGGCTDMCCGGYTDIKSEECEFKLRRSRFDATDPKCFYDLKMVLLDCGFSLFVE